MYFDGSRSYDRSGTGIVIISPRGKKLHYVVRFDFPATNNVAEYEALLAGLRVCKSIGVQHLMVCSNSQLIVQQYNKEYQCTEESMVKYLLEVRKFEKYFKNF